MANQPSIPKHPFPRGSSGPRIFILASVTIIVVGEPTPSGSAPISTPPALQQPQLARAA